MAMSTRTPGFSKLIEAFVTGRSAPPHNSMFVRSTDTASILFDYGEHFPMARRVHGVILFTTRKAWGQGGRGDYSATTEDHKRAVLSALLAMKPKPQVFHVFDVLARDSDDHEQNADDYIKRIQDMETESDRSRRYKGYIANDALALCEEAEDYCKRFKAWSDGRARLIAHLRMNLSTAVS